MTGKNHLRALTLALCGALWFGQPAKAEMILSQVVVDLLPGQPSRGDIEVWNSGDERMYVTAEPFEILNAGTPQEQRVPATDIEQSGLLVSPQKLILEPGERRIVRIAAIAPRPNKDRIYRVAIKPVGGPVEAEATAIKVFVGYDTLVLYRPSEVVGTVQVMRDGHNITIENRSNTAHEIFSGKQCDPSGARCQSLPAKRLYPGASFSQTLPFETPASYRTAHGTGVGELRF